MSLRLDEPDDDITNVTQTNSFLLAQQVKRLSTTVASLETVVSSIPSIIHKSVRQAMRDHIDDCEPRKHWYDMAHKTGEITGVVDTLKMQKSKNSTPPKVESAFALKIALGVVGALGTAVAIIFKLVM